MHAGRHCVASAHDLADVLHGEINSVGERALIHSRGTRNFSRKTWPGWVEAVDMASAERLIRLQHFLANLR